MNNSNRSTNSSSSLNSYQFNFNLSSSSPSRPLNNQPQRSATTNTKWTHQPLSAPTNLSSAPVSMVGDIFGKTWAPSPSSSSSLGLPKADPNLFGDLLGSALGNSRAPSNAPLKSSPAPRNSFSTGNLSDSLPKPSPAPAPAANSAYNRSGSWGSADNFANFNSSAPKTGNSNKIGVGIGGGVPLGASKSKDPFESLIGLGSKTAASKAPISTSANSSSKGGFDDFSSFGDFQGSNKASTGSANSSSKANLDHFASFGDFQGLNPPAANKVPMAASANSSSNANFDDFASFGGKDDFGSFSSVPPTQASAAAPAGVDPLDMFAGINISGSGAGAAGSGAEPFSEMNDWDIGGGDVDGGGMTTEIEGLPPPPAGVTASSAKTKGMDNYKQGQFADAIKWLSWAVVLLEKSKDSDLANEVLSCRASCYKEVGEYKKAVADCSKVLEQDSANVTILVQRALLYESMEKYRLGADDLRTVLKIDPGNRVARSTIHRLNQFAD